MKERCAAYGLRRKRALLQAVHTEEGEAGWLPLFYLCCFFSRRNPLLTYLCTPTERLSAVLRIFIYPIIGLLKKRRPKKRSEREMRRIWLAAKTCAFAGSSYRGRGSRLASPVLFMLLFLPSKSAPDVPMYADGATFGGSADFYLSHYRFLLLYAIFYGIIET